MFMKFGRFHTEVVSCATSVISHERGHVGQAKQETSLAR